MFDIITLMTWILAFLGFFALILLHELGHFLVARKVGIKAYRFSIFFPPFIFKKKIGETEYCLGTIPLGGYVKMLGFSPKEEVDEADKDRTFYSKTPLQRIAVIAAGPLVNIILAFVLITAFYLTTGSPVNTTKIAAKNQINQTININDELISVNGIKTNNIDSIRNQLEKLDCKETNCKVNAIVKRNNQLETLNLNVYYDKELQRNRLGITFLAENQPLGLIDSVKQTGDNSWYILKHTVMIPAKVFNEEERKELGSAVGAYKTTETIIDEQTDYTLLILGVISLSLGLINLLPLLPLDGGHILVAVIEMITKKPVDLAKMEKFAFIGFCLLIGLFIIGLSNDITRIKDGVI